MYLWMLFKALSDWTQKMNKYNKDVENQMILNELIVSYKDSKLFCKPCDTKKIFKEFKKNEAEQITDKVEIDKLINFLDQRNYKNLMNHLIQSLDKKAQLFNDDFKSYNSL